MSEPLRIVAIDSNELDIAWTERSLRSNEDHEFDFVGFTEKSDAFEYLAQNSVNAVVVDPFGLEGGIEVLNELRDFDSGLPVIALTEEESPETAVDLMHRGARDFLPKSRISPRSLCRSLVTAIEKAWLEQTIREQRIEVQRRNADLERRSKEIAGFYHMLSHEIKTPLTAAREFVSLVLDGLAGPVTTEQAEYLVIAREACDELKCHLDDLLDVTRLETGKLALKPEECDLVTLIDRAVESMRLDSRDHEIELTLRSPDVAVPVDGDPMRLRQVINNLISNGIKYNEPGGHVLVEISTEGEEARISIADDGIGIAPEHQERVFDRLFQVTDEDGFTKGLGLGLHLCEEIVRRHGGSIELDSALGKGSTFVVTLPLARDAQASSPRIETLTSSEA